MHRKSCQDEQAQLAALRAKQKAEKQKPAQPAVVKQAEPASKEDKKKATFVSDPCKGKSARFLSTCR